MSPNQIGDVIVNAALRVHTVLGPGLLESAYEACLAHEISKSGCWWSAKSRSRSDTMGLISTLATDWTCGWTGR